MNAITTLEGLLKNPNADASVAVFVIALLVSTASGFLVSLFYRLFYENRATGSQIHRSFLLIAPATTALFIAIQYSLPLSLGLVGALTIIRFRTPIKEPEEVAFLMVVIAASIVCATYRFVLLAILLGLVLVVLLLQKLLPRLFRAGGRSDGLVLVTLGASATDRNREGVVNLLREKLGNGKLQSISHENDVTTIHFGFSSMVASELLGIKEALDQVAPIEKLSVFYNRAGVL